MGDKHCKNCGRLLQPEDNYCLYAGRAPKPNACKSSRYGKDVFKKFLHATLGILHLTKALAVRPGQAIGDYIAGKRKEYYEPLKYLTFTVGISVLLTTYFDLMLANSADANPVSVFVAKHIDLIFLFSVPIAVGLQLLAFPAQGIQLRRTFGATRFSRGVFRRYSFYLSLPLCGFFPAVLFHHTLRLFFHVDRLRRLGQYPVDGRSEMADDPENHCNYALHASRDQHIYF